MQQLQFLNSQQDELKMSQARPNMERHLSQVECMLVRETMLRQEKMYREQVQALHYLYEVQKTLMDELRRKTFAKQENMTDLNSTFHPRDYQFFPLKAEEKPPGTRRNFDLEKLPDECLDDEEDLKPLNLNCKGDTNVELFLRCGATDHPDESQISKRLRRENIHDLSKMSTQSDQYNFGNEGIQNNQHHWLLQGPEISSWNSKQLPGLSLNSGYFRLDVPRNSNPWLQRPQPFPQTDSANCSQRFGVVKADPAIILGRNGLQDAPWYGEQRITMQQNAYPLQVNASSNAIHPWHAAGAVYFSDSYLRTANAPQSGISEALASAKPSSKWFGEQEEVFPSYLQRKDNRRLRNGNIDNDALHVFRRDPDGKSAGLGSRMFHTGRNLSGAVDYLRTQGEKLPKHSAQADGLKVASSSDNKQNVVLLPGYSEQKECDDVDKLAASILLSLILDKTTPAKEEMNPPFLKELATVFNKAIQAEEETGDSDMEAERNGNSETPELDHFEFATLQLKESSQVDHIPEAIAVEPDPTPQKSTTTTSGRPSRTCRKQRDFRNDTLPSIMSLSRQEITEDFQIMSGLVRSTSRDNAETCTINNNSRRGGKFCSISRLDSARVSPVSTLDLRQSPSSKRKSSRRAAVMASERQDEQDEQDEQEEDEHHEESASVLPWLVSWAESTRRKRMQRQRLKRPVKLFAALSSRGGGRKRGCT